MSAAPILAATGLIALIDDDHPPRAGEGRVLLDECAERFLTLLPTAARGVIESTDDLFEAIAEVQEGEVLHFRQQRRAWAERFEHTLDTLVRRRLAGTRRKGRRPDADVSVATLRVLSAFDQERQTAIVRSAAALGNAARQELAALDLRVDLLFSERSRGELDNPFGVAYVLDAIGASSRAVYPNPRVWRPLMARMLDDLTPAFVKICITLNRHLADRGVLPEIKAALRARSALRPADDRDLLPLFEKMLGAGGAPPGAAAMDIAVPAIDALKSGARQPALPPPSAELAVAVPPPSTEPAVTDQGSAKTGAYDAARSAQEEARQTLLAAYARHLERMAAEPPRDEAAATTRGTGVDDLAFPQLDSTLVLGAAGAVISELSRWQRFDPEHEIAGGGAARWVESAAALPLNRLRFIRDAIAPKIANPSDRLALDIVGLLFDYIFRDPSIGDAQRRIFARLQVPIAKAALLDRSFFFDRRHPARRLLDDLAAAAVGAHGDTRYQTEFAALAAETVDRVCAEFDIDMVVFEAATASVRRFVEHEHAAAADALHGDINAALTTETSDADHAEVRALVRDRLAGLEVPLTVRRFVETVWAEHLAAVHASDGTSSEAWKAALATLDDLLWSIATKERAAQKARLTRLVPSLVRRLRAGIDAVGLAGESVGSFFETLYRLHVAVLRPGGPAETASQPPAKGAAESSARGAATAAAGRGAGTTGATAAPAKTPFAGSGVHDFVHEMAIGTWVQFKHGEQETPARLFWVSPMRTRYIFTARGRAKAIAVTPEELATQLDAGLATVIVEPVPLFDRAVSAALDALAAPEPASAAAP